jgi:hypothetical protein
MIERLLPPWLLIVIGVLAVGAFAEVWLTWIVLALTAGHFILKHYKGEGLFGGKYGERKKED